MEKTSKTLETEENISEKILSFFLHFTQTNQQTNQKNSIKRQTSSKQNKTKQNREKEINMGI